MDRAILVFAVLGGLMFIAYVFFIIKTSYDDEKEKKRERQAALDSSTPLNGTGTSEKKNSN